MSDYPTQRLPIQPGADDGSYGGYYDDGQPRRRYRRRRRGLIIFLVTLVVLAVLFVIADRVAVRYADNKFASQVQTQGGLSNKPTVNIEGFPFLTQLAARKFNEVKISAATEKAGPVVIDNLQATMHGMQLIDGFSSARVQSLNGTGLITFGSLAKAADVPGPEHFRAEQYRGQGHHRPRLHLRQRGGQGDQGRRQQDQHRGGQRGRGSRCPHWAG